MVGFFCPFQKKIMVGFVGGRLPILCSGLNSFVLLEFCYHRCEPISVTPISLVQRFEKMFGFKNIYILKV
jgi:hypothetical protein